MLRARLKTAAWSMRWDNPIDQMVAQGILEDLGFSADLASNGVEALEALESKAYAAVLMDCQMPEMDDYAATAAIRHGEGTTRHTPIVAMTASAAEGDRERCLASGMDDYLPKPGPARGPRDGARMLGRP